MSICNWNGSVWLLYQEAVRNGFYWSKHPCVHDCDVIKVHQQNVGRFICIIWRHIYIWYKIKVWAFLSFIVSSLLNQYWTLMLLDALGSRKKYKRDINSREEKNSIKHQMQSNLLGSLWYVLMIIPCNCDL